MITKFKGRFRVVILQLSSLYPLLIEGLQYETVVGLATGANLYYKYYDKKHQIIHLMYTHPDWDVVEIGDQIPVQEIYMKSIGEKLVR